MIDSDLADLLSVLAVCLVYSFCFMLLILFTVWLLFKVVGGS